jgi:hypothetical protein
MCWRSPPGPMILAARRSGWTRPAPAPRRVTPPLPVAPCRPAREDYEDERGGVGNLFLVCEPLRAWRHVMVSARRTRADWAHCIKDLVDVHYPDAERIVLVQDNPEHSHAGVAGCGVRAGGGQAAGRQAGVARHAQAWELAAAWPRSSWPCWPGGAWTAPGRSGEAGAGGRGVGGGAQRLWSWGGLAVHDRRCPDQAQAPLPWNSRLTNY